MRLRKRVDKTYKHVLKIFLKNVIETLYKCYFNVLSKRCHNGYGNKHRNIETVRGNLNKKMILLNILSSNLL